MRSFLAITKALSDPSRVRMLCALRGGELCVCQLIALLDLAPSTVSKHLSILSQADLVESRKQGRWVHYRLPRKPASPTTGRMTKDTFRALADDETVLRDEMRLNDLRTADLEALCRKLLAKA